MGSCLAFPTFLPSNIDFDIRNYLAQGENTHFVWLSAVAAAGFRTGVVQVSGSGSFGPCVRVPRWHRRSLAGLLPPHCTAITQLA